MSNYRGLGTGGSVEGLGFNPLPPIINPPTPPNNKYSQYIIVYHMWGVFIIRGVGGVYYYGEGITVYGWRPKGSKFPDNRVIRF